MSTSKRLEMAAFERLLDIHGGRPERWPEPDREALEQLLASSALARARWSEAGRLEELLDAAPAIEPSAELMARVAAFPLRHPHPVRRGWWPFGNPLAPLAAWGVAAALGVVVGVTQTEAGAADADTEAAYEVAASEDDVAALDDWSELSGLVMGADWASEDD
jgi:hypothetical protein